MTSDDIRRLFFEYFAGKGHTIVPSSSLVPENDPTLLFTNAGMVQFKRVFTGEEGRSYKRAVSIQKCLRAGGKHNDLENVGFTARHHTFFEMLGNFSFGDYFKKEAVAMGWEFLTKTLCLPADRLWVSVYEKDDEAYELWRTAIGVSRDRIVRLGEKDNFWQMGDTGPCGPCSEVIIDQGPEVGCGRPECRVGCDCDRYLELWNLVFMQYEKKASGELLPLPKPSIDTGMGLERVTAVVQGVKSNYEADLFMPLIKAISKESGIVYDSPPRKSDVSLRVIADHLRAITFLISDGVIPSNEGSGYVLRRIIRRGARHGRLIGIQEPFLYKGVRYVIDLMRPHYPELQTNSGIISEITRREEEGFINTLEQGIRILDDIIKRAQEGGKRMIPGADLFKLYDTYGFPLDLAVDIAKEQDLVLDEEGFREAMEQQRERARRAGLGEDKINPVYKTLKSGNVATQFAGYEHLETRGRVAAIIRDGVVVNSAKAGEEIEVVFDITPFYGESGGQIGDQGIGIGPEGGIEVTDTLKPLDMIVHKARVTTGSITKREEWVLRVNRTSRQATTRSHTATHMLHAALRQTIGEHVKQAGSLVAPDRLRFDFIHFKPVSEVEMGRIEEMLNEKIRENIPVITEVMDVSQALQGGAMALFGEKYGEKVRVVQVPGFSKELCGGTHCKATGEIGVFRIASESGIAAGVRRIEALTGAAALRHFIESERTVAEISGMLKAKPAEVAGKAERLVTQFKEQEKEIARLKGQLTISQAKDISSEIREVEGIQVLSKRADPMSIDDLRNFAESLRSQMKSGVVAAGTGADDKAAIVVMVTKDLASQLDAREIIREIAPLVDGRGGGRADMAQAGGKRPEGLAEALGKVAGVVGEMAKRGKV
ncbi:MAG: alanine--tRNA ligase [Nitrospirae bacterium]|nr:alanine--tRNA ligase [Nitrospirota bacterium]